MPPLIEYTNEFEGKQCLRVKMRLALSLSGSEFLLNNENVGGNCSEVTLGWPSAPFPEIGRLILKFNLDTDSDGLEHAETGSIGRNRAIKYMALIDSLIFSIAFQERVAYLFNTIIIRQLTYRTDMILDSLKMIV